MDDELLRLAILGAGPIGLEAALYARYLGYPVEILERADQPVRSVLSLGEEPVGRFEELASTLGVAALRAQESNWQQPPAAQMLTPSQWREKYLLPLAASDLIVDVLHLGTEVTEITRRDEEDDESFDVRCRDSNGVEVTYSVDIIVDATGAGGSRAWFSAEPADPEISFLNPDADYYVLGGKSRPGEPFTFAEGIAQIRELFAILGEREDLDVYATLPRIE
jgi:hypothetical protein